MGDRAETEGPRQINVAAKRELMLAVQGIRADELGWVVIVSSGVDEITVLGGPYISRQRIRELPAQVLDSSQGMADIRFERGLKAIVCRASDGLKHLQYAE